MLLFILESFLLGHIQKQYSDVQGAYLDLGKRLNTNVLFMTVSVVRLTWSHVQKSLNVHLSMSNIYNEQ